MKPSGARLAVVTSGAVTRAARRVACGLGDALVATIKYRDVAHLVGRATGRGRAHRAVGAGFTAVQVTPSGARLAAGASGAVTRGARRVALGDALVGTSVRFGAALVGPAMAIGRALVAVVVQGINSVV